MDLATSRLPALLISIFLASGCASAQYTSPIDVQNPQLSSVIDADFETTWTAIIDHVSSTFFSIHNFEKESGLIIVDFGSSEIEDFVDCGQHEASWTDQSYTRHEFSGPYARFIRVYNQGKLDGRMNITARSLNESQTEVRVNARYVLNTHDSVWSFDSGSSDSVDVYQNEPRYDEAIRTCRPTYLAESSILEEINQIAQ